MKQETFIANNKNIKALVASEITRLGNHADLNHIDVSNITDFAYLFYTLKFNGDVSKWNTIKAKRMNSMFEFSQFNGDISKWNVSNVEDMHQIFKNSPFNQDISDWQFNQRLVFDHNMQRVIENSHNIRAEKELKLLKENIISTDRQTKYTTL